MSHSDRPSGPRPVPRGAVSCRGLSLVELLIGIALGLVIVSSGLAVLASQLQESRALVLETRLLQDLRSASDFITRELRRAGHWGDAHAGLWRAGQPPRANPYQALQSEAAPGLQLSYSRDARENHQVDPQEVSAFRLRNQVVELQLGNGPWQALTDPATVQVLRWQLTPGQQDLALPGLCERPCGAAPAAGLDCPPRLQVRLYELELQGRSPLDPRIERTLRTRVRVRNDAVIGACPP